MVSWAIREYLASKGIQERLGLMVLKALLVLTVLLVLKVQSDLLASRV